MMRRSCLAAALFAFLYWPASEASAYTCEMSYYYGQSLWSHAQQALAQGDYHGVEGGTLILWFAAISNNRDSDPWPHPPLDPRVTEDVAAGEPLSLLRGEESLRMIVRQSAPSRWFAVAVWTADDELGPDTRHQVRIDTEDARPATVRFDTELEEFDDEAVAEWLSATTIEVTLDATSTIYEKDCCIIRQRRPCASSVRDVVETSCRGLAQGALPRVTVTASDAVPATLPFIAARVEVPWEDTGFEARRGHHIARTPSDDGVLLRRNVIGPGGRISQPLSVVRPEVCLQALRISMENEDPEPVGEPLCMTLEVPDSGVQWSVGERRGGDECQGIELEYLASDWYEPGVERESNCLDEGTGLCAQLPDEPEWPPIPEESFSDTEEELDSDAGSDADSNAGSGADSNAGSGADSDTSGASRSDSGGSGCAVSSAPATAGGFALLMLALIGLRRR